MSCRNQSRLRDQYRFLPRFLDRTGRVDMLALWALETLFGFAGFYAVFAGIAVGPLPGATGGHGVTLADQALLLSVLLGVPGILLGLYKPDVVLETRRLLLTALVAAVCSAPLLWLMSATNMIDTRAVFGSTRAWLLALMLFWLLLLLGTRLLYAVCMRSGLFVRDVVLLGDAAATRSIAAVLAASHPRLFRVTPAEHAPQQPMMRSLRRPWQVVVDADRPVAVAVDNLRAWPGRPARVTDLGTFWERQLGRVDLCGLTDATAIGGLAREDATARVLHRGLDIVVASLLLVLTVPLMLLTALMVWLDSPGPLIYRQERVGLDGRPFVILKFRSMRVDAEADGKAMFATRNDQRVTRVGAFIRKVRFDELPQLFNILVGDMSVVGPRPERPDFVQLYDATIPFYRLRLRVKPGLTGWAQVNSAYTASETETRIKLAYDLYYLRNRSVLLDLSIIMATVRVILFGVGAR